MIWIRSIGIGLLAAGLFTGAVASRNLWVVWSAWNDLDHAAFAGIEFVGDPNVPATLRELWKENLFLLIGAIVIGIGGIILMLRKPRIDRLNIT